MIFKILDPHCEALFRKGKRLYDLGEWDKAIKVFTRVLNIKPDYYEAWFYQGTALYNLGRLEEAVISFDKALAIRPDDYYT